VSAAEETTICEAFLPDGSQCGREFPDELTWQEHYEDEHADDDEQVGASERGAL